MHFERYLVESTEADLGVRGIHMHVHVWEVPVNAPWRKSNILVDITYDEEGLEVVIQELESQRRWSLQFEEILAMKVIAEEWSGWSTEPLPQEWRLL